MLSIRSFSCPGLFSLLAAALFLLPPAPAVAQVIDIGPIVVPGGERGVVPVQIVSDQPDLRQAAEQAFAVHGGFRVVRDRSAASFVFTFRAAGGTRVGLDISSGNPLRSQFQETVTGTSLLNGLYRAADLAVAKTSGQPGFFAGQLAFVGQRTGAKEVYSSDLFLNEVVQLTRDGSDSIGPRWSPDGQKILYTSYYRSGFPDIFAIDVANRRRDPFVSVRGTNTGARFSPDGNRVAMVLSGEGSPELYVSNGNGQQIRRLTRTNAVQSSPAWSPDGSRIVFTSDRDGRPQLFTISASGAGMSRLPTNISGYCAEPDWNPRFANLIAFTAAVDRRFAVAVYDFSKRESRFLTQGSADAVEPRWTNDGRHLIYTARTSSSSTLMILDTQTGRSSPLSQRNLGKTAQADFWMAR